MSYVIIDLNIMHNIVIIVGDANPQRVREVLVSQGTSGGGSIYNISWDLPRDDNMIDVDHYEISTDSSNVVINVEKNVLYGIVMLDNGKEHTVIVSTIDRCNRRNSTSITVAVDVPKMSTPGEEYYFFKS